MATEEEVNEIRKRVGKKRSQLADVATREEQRVREASLDVDKAQLEAEEARLDAQLAATRENAKVGNVRSGVAPLVEEAREQEKAAEAQAAAIREGQ